MTEQPMNNENVIKKKGGRPKGKLNIDRGIMRYRIKYLNPKTKDTICIDEFKTIEDIAKKFNVTKWSIYKAINNKEKRYEFTQIEKIIRNE